MILCKGCKSYFALLEETKVRYLNKAGLTLKVLSNCAFCVGKKAMQLPSLSMKQAFF